MEYNRNEVYSGDVEQTAYNESFHKVLRLFTISVLVAFIGTAVGTQLPPALFLPLVIVEVVMLIAAMFMRKRRIGYGFLFTFVFISGITIYPAIAYYVSSGGAGMVNTAFILTVIIYASLTYYAYKSQRDFSFLGGFLMIGIIALIGFSLVGLFLPGLHSGPLGLGIAFGGVLIFSGFVLYDVSQYKHGVPEDMIPTAVLGLYLNFINLFLYLLRLLNILNSDD
ncbi:Bax inhibitor-1/YccA family protein [Marinicrinis sediminis]|uniref:Bax inhibitor-1 family protein n=1 Tax=Marinicrinis sediminis TaxID=1652465 RepID=A0ABW5RA59_9BACL